jgi:hypothetical protein
MGTVVVDHRGCLFDPIAGLYTFYIYQSDNIVEIWLCTVAYSGWNQGNYIIEALYTEGVRSYTTLRAAEYIDLRVF